MKLAKQWCGDWPAGRTPRPTDEARPKGGKSIIAKESSTQQHVMQMAAAPVGDKPPAAGRRTAFRRCRATTRAAGSIGTWSIPAWPSRPTSPTTNTTAAVPISPTSARRPNRLRTISSGSPPFTPTSMSAASREEELEQAQNKVASRIVLRSERPMGRLSSLGSNWVYRGEYRSVQDDLDAFRKITADDVSRPFGHLSIGTAFDRRRRPLGHFLGAAPLVSRWSWPSQPAPNL